MVGIAFWVMLAVAIGSVVYFNRTWKTWPFVVTLAAGLMTLILSVVWVFEYDAREEQKCSDAGGTIITTGSGKMRSDDCFVIRDGQIVEIPT